MKPLKVVSSGSKQFSRQTPPAPSGTLSTKNLNVHPTIKGDPNCGLDELEPNRLIFLIFAWDALHYIQCILYIVCNACTNTLILLKRLDSQGGKPPRKKRFSLGKRTQIWVGEVEWSQTFIKNCVRKNDWALRQFVNVM